MTIDKFIKECSKQNSPIGDLANDILEDTSFPSNSSEEEIFRYLEFKTISGGTHDTFLNFTEEYLNSK